MRETANHKPDDLLERVITGLRAREVPMFPHPRVAFPGQRTASGELTSSSPFPWRRRLMATRRVMPRVLGVAACALACLAGWWAISNSTPNGQGTAWAEVVQALEQVPWMHFRPHEPTTAAELEDKREIWRCFDKNITALRGARGDRVVFAYFQTDQITQQFYVDPESPPPGFVAVQWQTHRDEVDWQRKRTNPLEWIRLGMDGKSPLGVRLADEVQYRVRREQQDARAYEVHEWMQTRNKPALWFRQKLEVWVTPEDHLPRFDRLWVQMREDGKLEERSGNKYDYPQTGPNSIFDLGVPKDVAFQTVPAPQQPAGGKAVTIKPPAQ